jgi:chromosome segregation ATPase
VKNALLAELAESESAMRTASHRFRKRLRSLHDESAAARRELREAQKLLYRVRDSDKKVNNQGLFLTSPLAPPCLLDLMTF